MFAPNCAQPRGSATWGRVLIFGGSAWLLGVALLVWLSQPVSDTVPATLEAKTTSVTVSHPARLAELFVTAGQRVEPATPLFRLADERLSARIAAKRREIVELAAEVQRVEAAAEVDLAWRRRDLQRDAFDLRLKMVQLEHARVHHQVEQIAWQERSAGLDYWIGDWDDDRAVRPMLIFPEAVPPTRLQALLQADETTSTLEADADRIAVCEQKLAEIAELEAKLIQKVRISTGVDVAQARLQRAEDELKALEQQDQTLTILSPGFGTVGSLAMQTGEALAAGECVIELLDDDQRFLVAQVPSARIGKFRPDAKVTVLFPQKQRFQGAVGEIPPQALEAAGTDDARIPVRIMPCGKLWPKLPIGSRVTVEMPL